MRDLTTPNVMGGLFGQSETAIPKSFAACFSWLDQGTLGLGVES